MRPRTNPRNFERYMRWGVLAFGLFPIPVIVGMAGTMPAMVAAAVLISGVGFCAVQVWFSWHMLAATVAPQTWTRDLWGKTGIMVGTAAITTVLLLLLTPTATAVWAYPLCLAATAIAVGQRMWQMLLSVLSVEVVIVLVLAWSTRNGASEAIQAGVVWIVFAALLIFTGWSSGWMLRVMADLREARAAAAWVATSEERGRISRDLHDLFGQTLSTIAVKSELAAELARRGRTERAVAEMRGVHELSRDSGDRVRAVVRGDRGLDLPAEVVGAQAVLESAGIACRATAESVTDELVASKLAWVLREAVTNILRHSSARSVGIELTADPTRLVIRNDHPHPMGGAAGGLHGIRDRLAEVDGVVEWQHMGAEFVLDVTVPDTDGSGAGTGGTSPGLTRSRPDATTASREEE